jgi:FkbH-like protein
MLILDLDNTLWGGVIGEDGIEGISLGGDYPGNVYQAFQESLKRLNEKGLALGIVSKNSEEDAFNVIDNHPEMVLRRDHFVSTRINWEDKVTNIIDIANEVGLGLENIGFVDDNPVERGKMRQQLPQVKVFEIGRDATEYSRILYSDPFLHITEVTEEDKRRTKAYADRTRIINQKMQFSSVEDFYRDLNVKIFVQNIDQYNIARAHQLIQKTNQFNATGRRYTKSELLSLGTTVIVVAASDKYSKRENLGIVVAKETKQEELTVSTYILSCRALGKSIEKTIFEWLVREAVKANLKAVVFEFTKTERNRPVEELYKAANMNLCKDGYILNEIDRVDYEIDWVTIVDERGVNHT